MSIILNKINEAISLLEREDNGGAIAILNDAVDVIESANYDTKEPVGNTCGVIDSAIYSMKKAIDEISDDDERGCADKHRYNAESYMEEVRDANSALREWGKNLAHVLYDLIG